MWSKLKGQFNKLKIEKRRLYLLVNSDDFESKNDYLDTIAAALNGGVEVVQLDEHNFPDDVVIDLGHKIRALCDEYGATFLLNNRVDIAKIVAADGVHLGPHDMSIVDAKYILGNQSIIGMSASTKDEIARAITLGADYIALGPISTSKIATPVDFELMYWVERNVEVPVFIYGRFDLEDLEGYVANSLKRIILSDEILHAKNPTACARNISSRLPIITD